MPAAYPLEFRRRAVDLARRGDRPIAELARELGVAESGLRRWMARADADERPTSSGTLTTAEREELVALRRDKRRLELENEILKRAAAFFAKENVLPK